MDEKSLIERALWQQGFVHIAGVDEAGRGPLAGPVVAGAAIVPANSSYVPLLDDSKKLSVKNREFLFEALTSDQNVYYAIGIASVEEIDQINILQASLLAMQRAVKNLSIVPDFLLIDGRDILKNSIPSQAVVRGDSRSYSIAAASVLAKVTRDRMMGDLDRQWPLYGFKKHKGYGTRDHKNAIASLGVLSVHRKSFEPIKSMVLADLASKG